jgi:NitT/TauT family transport system substrate-binding protein
MIRLGTAVLAALVTMAATAWAQVEAPVRVRYAVITIGTFNVAVPLAQRQGLFVKHGLDVEIVTVDTTPTALAALVSGSAQFAFAGSNIADAVVAGVPVALVYANGNVPALEICALKTMTTAKDMIGKTIGLQNRGSTPDITFRTWLQAQGVGADQVTIRNIDAGVPAILAASSSGQIQSYVLSPPRCFQDAANGFHVLGDLGDGSIKFLGAGVAVTRAYLESNRATVRKFLAALVDARKLFQDDAGLALSVIKEIERLSDDPTARNIWDYYKTHLASPPLVSEEAMLEVVKNSANARTREAGPALVGKMYDNSVLEEVVGK